MYTETGIAPVQNLNVAITMQKEIASLVRSQCAKQDHSEAETVTALILQNTQTGKESILTCVWLHSACPIPQQKWPNPLANPHAPQMSYEQVGMADHHMALAVSGLLLQLNESNQIHWVCIPRTLFHVILVHRAPWLPYLWANNPCDTHFLLINSAIGLLHVHMLWCIVVVLTYQDSPFAPHGSHKYRDGATVHSNYSLIRSLICLIIRLFGCLLIAWIIEDGQARGTQLC